MPSKFGGIPVDDRPRSKFGGVPVDDDELAQAQAAPITDLEPVRVTPDPTDGMSTSERVLAGIGQSLDSGYRGIVQAGTEHFASQADWLRRGLGAAGLDGAAGLVDRTVGAPLRTRVTDLRAEEAERRELDAPLLRTGGGMTGAVIGGVAQVVGPGGVAKLAGRTPAVVRRLPNVGALGSALLPKTLKGNAALGAGIGASQPVAGDGERLTSAGAGGAFGYAGAALPRVVGSTIRAGQRAASPLTRKGGERRAVETILREADSPERLMRPQPSQVPGVRRSLFEETQDAGVARLETRSRGNGGGWVERDKSNNAARVRAIEEFAGTPDALRRATAERSRATTPLREAAMRDSGVDVGAVRGTLRSLIENPQTKTNKSRLAALLDVEKSLDDADDSVASLYGTRQYIDALMQGKAGSDKTYARAAKADLQSLKSTLDREIAKVSPAFGGYLSDFIDYSRPLDRMKVGQRLLRDGSGNNMDDATGLYTLMPGQFGKSVKNLDALTERATKFRGKTAEDALRPQDLATIRAVDDDLARQSRRLMVGSGGGSHTAPQAELGKRVVAQGLARVIPFAGAAVEFLEKAGARHLERHLAVVLQNPEQFRTVAAQLSRSEQRLLEQAFVRAGGVAGITGAGPAQ